MADIEQARARTLRDRGFIQFAAGEGKEVAYGLGYANITSITVFFHSDGSRVYISYDCSFGGWNTGSSQKEVEFDLEEWEVFQRDFKITLGERENIDEAIMD